MTEIIITIFILLLIFTFFVIRYLIKDDDNDSINTQQTKTQMPEYLMPPSFMEETKRKEANADKNYKKAVRLFKELIEKFSYKVFEISNTECVFLIESKLAVYIGLKKFYRCISTFSDDYDISHHVKVEELLYNDLFKFNGAKFSRNFENEYEIYIRKFSGLLNKQAWGVDEKGNPDGSEFERIERILPQLELRKRYDEWLGVLYHFVIFEYIYFSKKKTEVKYTTHSNIANYVHSYYSKNYNYMKYSDCTYFYFDKYIKEETTLQNEVENTIIAINNGEYDNIIRKRYIHPESKWKSEQRVYQCCKNIFGDNNVICQYHPHYLGQMSYDVFIVSLKVAIEYQGKQHFEPVEFFGGIDTFKKQVERDKLKKKLSAENGVTLIYINYDEDITEELIQQKIKQANT